MGMKKAILKSLEIILDAYYGSTFKFTTVFRQMDLELKDVFALSCSKILSPSFLSKESPIMTVLGF